MGKNTVKNSIKIGSTLLILAFILFKFESLKAVFYVVSNILMPFVIGAVIALFVSVPLRRIEILLRRRVFKTTDSKALYRGVSLILTIILIIIFMFFAIRSVVPDLISTIRQFGENLPRIIQQFLEWFQGVINTETDIFDTVVKELEEVSNGIRENLQQYIQAVFLDGIGFVSTTFSFLFTAFLAVSFALYLLFYKETFGRQIKKALFAFLNEDAAQSILITGARLGSSFQNFIEV